MTRLQSICVFCGSRRGTDPALADVAADLGRTLADNGITLVYGAGGVGLMDVVAQAALDAGGKVTGVMPRHLARKELLKEGLTELHIVDSMHDRKRVMFELSFPNEKVAKEALIRAAHKLPMKCRVIRREAGES